MAWDKIIEDRDREQKISDQIPITILLLKMDRRSDHDPQKKDRDPDLSIMDRKILMP